MWAGHLVRRGWRATVFLVLLAGLSGGVAMAASAAGRRTVTAFDRFLERADPPQLMVTFCPPDMIEIVEAELDRCFNYSAVDETKVLNDLPEVDQAARASFHGLTAARPDKPDATWVAISTLVSGDLTSIEGEQILVAGRWFSPQAADEVVVNEKFQERSGITIGEEIILTFWGADEIGRVPAAGEKLNGPSALVRVVGVARGLLDLSASTGDIREIDEAEVMGGSALAIAATDAGGYGGVVIRARGDADVAAAIERAFPNRQFNIASVIGDDEIEPIREAIDYEARAALAFAAIASIAAAVFVGQAVARQSRREWSDISTLHALGMAPREMRWAAIIRGGLMGCAAAIVAVAVAVALSPLGPIGVGRRAEVDPGVLIDVPVLVVGTLILILLITAASVIPLTRRSRPKRDADLSRIRRLRSHSSLPAAAVAGLSMTTAGRRDETATPIGTAIAGVSLAVVTIVVAAGLTASLDSLTRTPESFGAPWDVSVMDISGDAAGTFEDFTSVLASHPAVEAAAGIVGTDVEIGDEDFWVQAFRPIDNVAGIAPVITAGRQPGAVDEIALGSITMGNLGVEIGDSVVVESTVSGGAPSTMTVVGTTIVNDTYETSPGRGGVVALEWIDANSPETFPDPYVVRLDENADVSAFKAAVESQLPAVVSTPAPHSAIRNVERISSLPFLLAVLVALLAMASLAHALTLSIRRSRDQLAVWKSIGFTGGQVRSAVAWHASALAVAATLIGVPIGVVLGRVGWRVVADQIGVASNPVTPLVGMTLAALATLAIANLIAAYPGWRAARLPTAQALRAE
jgi:ABC-type lipoprotein release transport system permease subunit